MKKLLLLVLITHSAMSLKQEYKKLESYGDTLYNLIAEYVQLNASESSQDVINFINSTATNAIFSDAKIAGYSKEKVLFSCYQSSFLVTPNNDAIISGIHDVLVQNEMVNDAAYYGSFANMGFISLIFLYIIRSVYVYRKFDKPLLDFYRTNDTNYNKYSLISATRSLLRTNGPFAETNNNNTNSPLLEPILQ